MFKSLEKLISANPKLAGLISAAIGWVVGHYDLINRMLDTLDKPA